MTIKKTILGFMVAALLMGAAVCQASEVTITRYNKKNDEQLFLKTLLTPIIIEGMSEECHETPTEAIVLMPLLTGSDENEKTKNTNNDIDLNLNVEELVELYIKDLNKPLVNSFTISTPSGIKGIIGYIKGDLKSNGLTSSLLRIVIIADATFRTSIEGQNILEKALEQFITVIKKDDSVSALIWTPSIYAELSLCPVFNKLKFTKNEWAVAHCAAGIDYILPLKSDCNLDDLMSAPYL